MNVTNQKKPLGLLYQEILKTREEVDKLVVDSERIEALSGALDTSLEIIGDISMLAAAFDSSLTAICRKLDKLAEDPVMGERLTQEFQDLVALKSKLLDGAFKDVVYFIRKFDQMVRNDILTKAGIDPRDKDASMAYLLKLGQSIVLPDLNVGN